MQIESAVLPKKTNMPVVTRYVTGDSGNRYIVHHKRNSVTHRKVWTCDCKDFTERRVFQNTLCKHIEFIQKMFPSHQQKQTFNSTPPIVPTVRTILNQIVQFLNGIERSEVQDLWNILTVLRGPDSDDDALKEKTTASLRGALGLKVCGAIINTHSPFGTDYLNSNYLRIAGIEQLKKSFPGTQHHFADHYFLALGALKRQGYIK